MNSTGPCPSDLAIEQYLLAELGPSRVQVGDHITTCGICRTKVADKTAHNAAFATSPGAEKIRNAIFVREQLLPALPPPGRALPATLSGSLPPGRALPLSTALAPSPNPRRLHIVAALGFAAALALAFGLTLRPPSSVTSSPAIRPTPTSFAAQPTHDEEVVLRVQREWMEAVRDKDVAALDRILADDYTYTDARGRVSNKADNLQQARAGGGRMNAFHTSDAKARVYGDLAIVTGRLRVEGVASGRTYDSEVRFTDILARIDGRWRAVAAHASKPTDVE
jgi:ketosteroid isomerase-like protein